MRKLWIVVGVLLVLSVATAVTAVLSLNRLIAGHQERLITQAQAVLGRRVTVARISVGFWGGVGVRLDDLRIGDDPGFGSEDFVQVAMLTVSPKLWPLLHQRFEVSRIVAVQPHVNLIRDAGGRWNYPTIRPPAVPGTSSLVPGIIRAAASTSDVVAPSRPLPSLAVQATVSDCTLVIVDPTATPVRRLQLAHVDAALGYTDPTSPIEVRVAAAIATDARNIDVHGSVGPRSEHPGLPLQLDGTLGPLGPHNARVDGLHVVATLTADHIHVTELTGRSLGGTFAFSGAYPLHAGAPVTLQGTVSDLAVTEAIQAATEDGAPRLGGAAHLTIDLRGIGTSREAIEASLNGSVAIDVRDGVIKDLNIANEVLERFGDVPIIGPVTSAKLRPKYARLFADPDTHFQVLHGSFTIGGKRAQTEDLTIVAPDYGVLGRGWLAFNGQTNLAGTLRMSQRLSGDIVGDVKEAKYLLDDHAQLTVPFHLVGTLAKAKPTLDSDDIISIVQRGAARGNAKNLLDKLLGGKRQATPGAAKDLIEQGLHRLFGH